MAIPAAPSAAVTSHQTCRQAQHRAHANATAMFTVIYRWRVKVDMEPAFIRAWHNRTEKIYAMRGSYGSRLHREPDGTFCAIALWPSREAWEATEPPLPDDEADEATFRDAVAEWLPTLTMEGVDDLWRRPADN